MRAAFPLIVAALVAVGGWFQAARLEQRLAVLESRQSGDDAGDDGPNAAERLTTLEATLKSMSESLFNQATDVSVLKQERDRLRKARIDLDDKTFSRVETPVGPLFVQAEAVRRKPEETAVELLLGNPSAAGLTNATLRARWGRAFDPSGDFQLWQDGLKEKDFSVKDTLRPGSWSRYTLRLETGPVTQVGFLEVSIEAKTVLLQDVTTVTTTVPRPTPSIAPKKRPADPVGDDRPEPDLLDPAGRTAPAPPVAPRASPKASGPLPSTAPARRKLSPPTTVP